MDGSSQLAEISTRPFALVSLADESAAASLRPHPDAAGTLIPDGPALLDLSPVERQLFRQFGSGERADPRHKLIHAPFEAFARRQPDAVAVRHRGIEISYRRLDAEGNRLARILTEHGVRRGDAVALFLERSIPMVVGILATLKIGAAYVP